MVETNTLKTINLSFFASLLACAHTNADTDVEKRDIFTLTD